LNQDFTVIIHDIPTLLALEMMDGV